MSESTEEWVERMVAELLPHGGRTVSLDEIGEVMGVAQVGSLEVERLISCLESAGATILASETEGLVSVLQKVIKTAQFLRKEGKRPSAENISERSGLSARAVRVALLYADVLKAER